MIGGDVTPDSPRKDSNVPQTSKPFDAANYFSTDDQQLDLLNDALHEGHPGYIAAAIGTIAKARGLSEVARDAGLSRQTLHRALTESGNPTIETVMKVLAELRIELSAKAKVTEPA